MGRSYYERKAAEEEQKLINYIAVRGEYPEARRTAIAQVVDMDVLEYIACNDTDITLRVFAVEHIRYEKTLVDVLSNTVPELVAYAVVQNLQEEENFIKVAKENCFKSVRLYALKQVDDQYVRAEIAAYESDAEIALEALSTIDNVDLLRMICKVRANEVSLVGVSAFEKLRKLFYEEQNIRNNHFVAVI